jgi:hypothetical protein
MAAVKRYANVPTSQVTFQPADFYALADDSIRAKLVPLIIKHCEEFYVYPKNYTVATNQSIYAIPPRAINMMLRSVQLIDPSNPDSRVNLERLNIEDLYASAGSGIMMKKSGFYIEGNNVVLYPAVTQNPNATLRLNYFIRPNQLVDVTACAQILSVNLATNQITCSAIPANFSILNTFDIVKANPGFDCTAIDQSATSVSSGVITFTSALPSNISPGDYVCLAGQSCVVQVPVELQPLLYQYVIIRLLSAQGDHTALKEAMSELEQLERNASVLLAPRVQGSVKRVVNSRSITRLV